MEGEPRMELSRWRPKAELNAQATKAEGIRKITAEPEGRWSRTEKWSDGEAKPEEWSPEVADGQRLTKAEPEGRGSLAEMVA